MKLKNVKYELVEIDEGSIKEIKPRLPYQLCFVIGTGVDCGISLCGVYNFSAPSYLKAAGRKFYILARTKDVYMRGDYTPEEINILSRVLNVAIDSYNNPRLTEILIRAIDDEILTAAFYDQVTKDKLYERITRLVNGSIYLPGRKLRPTQYDRQRYSVYQLLQDLVKDKAKIFIDKEYLDHFYTKISASKSLERGTGFWGSILSVQGNQERANLNLLIRGEDSGLMSLCIVKDGVTWMTEMIVKVNSKHLRSRLYGAKLIEDKFLGDMEFYLNLRSIPVIGKRYLRGIGKKEYLRSCFNLLVQEAAWKKALSLSPEKLESPAKESSAKDIKPEKIKSYVSQGIGFKMSRSLFAAKNWVDKNIHDFSLETRKRELEEARKEKRDIAFRYLMSKKEEWEQVEEIESWSMRLKKKEIKVRVYED